MINCPIENAYCDAADEGAALGLLGLMTGISEEYWCAGWMSGLEFALWNAQDGQQYGQGILTARQCMLLRLLSEECDGWWCWRDGPTFVSTAEWLKMLPTDAAVSHPEPGAMRSERSERATSLLPAKEGE